VTNIATETTTETRSVVIDRELPFAPEKIWRALTQPQLIEEWLMKNDFKPVVGHSFNLRQTGALLTVRSWQSNRTGRCRTAGLPMVWRVSSPGPSRLRAPAPVCAWNSRASGRISSRPTRVRTMVGRSSSAAWNRSSRGWTGDEIGAAAAAPHLRDGLGPVGFEPTTKGFTQPRRFRREWTISSPVHKAMRVGAGCSTPVIKGAQALR